MKKPMISKAGFLIAFFCILGCLLFYACEKPDKPDKIILKLASSPVGADSKKIWGNIADEFNQLHPHVTLKYYGMDALHYESTVLESLLLHENPEIYFEWGGERVKTRKQNGLAADITQELEVNGWKNDFSQSAWNGSMIDNRVFMVPYFGQVSNVFWFNILKLHETNFIL